VTPTPGSQHGISLKGVWKGTASMRGATQRMVVVLDSTAAGWTGSTVAPDDDPESLKLDSIQVSTDSLKYRVLVNRTAVKVRAAISGDVCTGIISIGGHRCRHAAVGPLERDESPGSKRT
jgi:hypothetical protein